MFNKSIACIILMCGALFSCSYCPPDRLDGKYNYAAHEGNPKTEERLRIVKASKTFKELVNKVHKIVVDHATAKRRSASSHISLKACAEYCAQVIEGTALEPNLFAEYVKTHGKLTSHNEPLLEAMIEGGPLNCFCDCPKDLYRCVYKLSKTRELIV